MGLSEQLAELSRMYASGYLTDEQFADAKRQLLAGAGDQATQKRSSAWLVDPPYEPRRVSGSWWVRQLKRSLVAGVVAVGPFLLFFVVGLLTGRVDSRDFRDTRTELEQYVDGVIAADLDRMEPHLCEWIADEILALPGGLEQARAETFATLPAPLAEVRGVSGDALSARLQLSLTNGDDIVRYLLVIWDQNDERPKFCPRLATELLGRPYPYR